MEKKMTVVSKYTAIKDMLNGNEATAEFTLEDALAFLDERIVQTERKNASGKSADPTPKEREKMAANAEVESAILAEMESGKEYQVTDMIKQFACVADYSTQKLTPRLTALVKAGSLVRGKSKGHTTYSLAE